MTTHATTAPTPQTRHEDALWALELAIHRDKADLAELARLASELAVATQSSSGILRRGGPAAARST